MVEKAPKFQPSPHPQELPVTPTKHTNHNGLRRISSIAIMLIKDPKLPSEALEGVNPVASLDTALKAKKEAFSRLKEFIKTHNLSKLKLHDKQEYAGLQWDLAKSIVRLKEVQLMYLAVTHAPLPAELDSEIGIDPDFAERYANAHHELTQARLEAAAAKTNFFCQKVEVARFNLGNKKLPTSQGNLLEHHHFLALKGIFIAAMSQHMTAYLEEAEIRFGDAQEIMSALEAQGDIAGEIYATARTYFREAEQALLDAQQAHADALETIDPSKLASLKKTPLL